MKRASKVLILVVLFQALVLLFVGIGNRYTKIASGQIVIATIAIIASSLVMVLGWIWKAEFSKCEIGLGLMLSISIGLNIGIFGPIFVDRSISYHIVMGSDSGNAYNVSSLYKTCETQVDKRVTELQALNLITKSSSGLIERTPVGSVVANMWKEVGLLTGTLSEWIRFSTKLQ